MPIKLIIFDLDGTLVNSLTDLTIALNRAFQANGLPPLSEERVRGLVGEGITRLIEKALPARALGLREKVLQGFLDYYSSHLLDNTRAYPGVAEMLSNLEGFRKAVISNKRSPYTKKILEGLGIARHFDLIAGPDTVNEKKPSPEPVFHVLRTLGIDPAETIMVGDSPLDVEAGKKAGLRRTVAVTYGYNEDARLAEADYLIDSIDLLIPMLYKKEPMLERRKSPRYQATAEFQEYFSLRVRIGGEYIPAVFVDLSLGGMRFECPIPFNNGERIDCIISAPRSLNKEVVLKLEAAHCHPLDPGFMVAGRILEIDDETWFRVLRKVYDFIEKRRGDLY
ncbi:MAG: HAD-IA family hydrolase [Nitrospiraceae bacterium]|nr:HAD-IA family hydrolase [Nitrospiraceae bacterium]